MPTSPLATNDLQAVLEAACNGDEARVMAWLDAGGDIDAAAGQGYNLLLVTTRYGQAALARKLLARGADPRRTLATGHTALHHAIAALREVPDWMSVDGLPVDTEQRRRELRELCRELVAAGVDVNAEKIPSRQRALRDAAEADEEVALFLLASGNAEIDAADSDGLTALHKAVAPGRQRLVEVLLAAGADPNATDAYGLTPLHEAARRGLLAAMLALVQAGADRDRRVTKAIDGAEVGDTAADLARRRSALHGGYHKFLEPGSPGELASRLGTHLGMDALLLDRFLADPRDPELGYYVEKLAERRRGQVERAGLLAAVDLWPLGEPGLRYTAKALPIFRRAGDWTVNLGYKRTSAPEPLASLDDRAILRHVVLWMELGEEASLEPLAALQAVGRGKKVKPFDFSGLPSGEVPDPRDADRLLQVWVRGLAPDDVGVLEALLNHRLAPSFIGALARWLGADTTGWKAEGMDRGVPLLRALRERHPDAYEKLAGLYANGEGDVPAAMTAFAAVGASHDERYTNGEGEGKHRGLRILRGDKLVLVHTFVSETERGTLKVKLAKTSAEAVAYADKQRAAATAKWKKVERLA